MRGRSQNLTTTQPPEPDHETTLGRRKPNRYNSIGGCQYLSHTTIFALEPDRQRAEGALLAEQQPAHPARVGCCLRQCPSSEMDF